MSNELVDSEDSVSGCGESPCLFVFFSCFSLSHLMVIARRGRGEGRGGAGGGLGARIGY